MCMEVYLYYCCICYHSVCKLTHYTLPDTTNLTSALLPITATRDSHM
jgi:hypothetical protein